MQSVIITTIAQIVAKLDPDATVELTRPDPKFGDWTTNVALRIAKKIGKPPRIVAKEIVDSLEKDLDPGYKVSIAGPGFINVFTPDEHLLELLDEVKNMGELYGTNNLLGSKKVIVEGTDPNPFKQLHIGHVYSNTIGEAITGLYKNSGAEVIKANYQGDVGMHVAMSLWGINQLLEGREMSDINEVDRPKFLGDAYAKGANAYKEDDSAKQEIAKLNKQVYTDDPEVTDMYKTGRQWSLDYFEKAYKRLETSFDSYYFEKQAGKEGLKVIEQNKAIFEESDGALVYKGEQDGLHTRVFINKQGFPTYEGKELGLASIKEKEHNADISITFTGNEIEEYFKVIKAVLHKINPVWSNKIVHIPHGMVRLPEGKMSSRTGKVITAEWLLDTTEEMVRQQSGKDAPSVIQNTLGAIKYAFLKHRIGGNIAFDIADSISLEGNSGPYIQYAFVRTNSIIKKSTVKTTTPIDLEPDERNLVQLIAQYPEVVEKSLENHAPHYICTYIFELAQNFNRFYEHNRVFDDDREATRIQIVNAVSQTLGNALRLLNIPTPKEM